MLLILPPKFNYPKFIIVRLSMRLCHTKIQLHPTQKSMSSKQGKISLFPLISGAPKSYPV